MLYELAHFIKDKCSFLWDAVEWGNAYAFSLLHKESLKELPKLLKGISNETFTVRMTEGMDATRLEKFFAEQPEDAFEFFKPHGFDRKSIQKILRNKAFQTFVITEHDEIVGYFFLRSFVNGKCFKGRMVDYRQRNRGIAKLMGKAINETAVLMGLRIFTTISPNNYASLASTKAVNDIKVVKTLDNGYYYIECTPKVNKTNSGGGNN